MAEGRVDDIYERVKDMTVTFALRPGERLNEGSLARDLGVSRTPLREALNRLVTERMVEFRPGAGFFCRALDAQTIFDLYEVRRTLECEAARLVCDRASDEALARLKRDLWETGLDIAGLTVAKACARDERFHEEIASMSGNAVLAEHLSKVNERIRYIRWVNLSDGRLRRSKEEHVALMQALLDRDADRAQEVLAAHIDKRMDQVVDAVKQGVANIFLNTTDELTERVLLEVAT